MGGLHLQGNFLYHASILKHVARHSTDSPANKYGYKREQTAHGTAEALGTPYSTVIRILKELEVEGFVRSPGRFTVAGSKKISIVWEITSTGRARVAIMSTSMSEQAVLTLHDAVIKTLACACLDKNCRERLGIALRGLQAA